jgi:hypothetical protein
MVCSATVSFFVVPERKFSYSQNTYIPLLMLCTKGGQHEKMETGAPRRQAIPKGEFETHG